MLAQVVGHESSAWPTTSLVDAALQPQHRFQPTRLSATSELACEMDGYEVARHIRQNPPPGGVMLVAVTSRTKHDKQRCIKTARPTHGFKPVESADLNGFAAGNPSPQKNANQRPVKLA